MQHRLVISWAFSRIPCIHMCASGIWYVISWKEVCLNQNFFEVTFDGTGDTVSHSLHTLLLPLTWFQAVSRSCWDRKGVQICVSNTLLQWSQLFMHVVWFFKLWMNPSYKICNQFWSHQQRQWHCLLSFASMLFIWNLMSETSNSRLIAIVGLRSERQFVFNAY